MAIDHCVELSGLPGIRAKHVKAPYADTPTAAMNALKKYRAVTASGSDGAINAYCDDAGRYRAHFCRYLRTVDEQAFKTKTALRKWLTVWYPRMHDFKTGTQP